MENVGQKYCNKVGKYRENYGNKFEKEKGKSAIIKFENVGQKYGYRLRKCKEKVRL